MSTLSGRWRCDYAPSLNPATPTVTTWHATETAAKAEETAQARVCGGRAVAWWWPGEYIETPGEEARRTVRESLAARFTWLRDAA